MHHPDISLHGCPVLLLVWREWAGRLCGTEQMAYQLTFAELAGIGGQQAEDDHCKAFIVLYIAGLNMLFSDAGG